MPDPDEQPIPIPTPDTTPDVVEPHPAPRPGQSGREPKRNPPDESTPTETPNREDVGVEGELIDLPAQAPPPEVVEEGGNPVARLIRRLLRQ
jgi:hypothetical protein